MQLFVKYKLLICLLTTWLVGIEMQNLFAQTRISLAPQVSYEAIQTYVVDNGIDPTFRAYNRHFSAAYGLNVQLDVNRNWMYAIGWSMSTPVLGFKYQDTGPNLWRITGALSHRFSLSIQKTIGTHHLFKLRDNSPIVKLSEKLFGSSQSAGDRYLLLFRTRLISGISYDLLQSIPGELLTDNGQNISAIVGLGLQFFNYRKDHLQLNFIYSHGIWKVTEGEMRYHSGGTEYIASLGSRGSYFAFQFAYPMRLFESE